MTPIRYLLLRSASRPPTPRWGDRGEGVISAAIAVLVMAFLGVAMWLGLRGIWDNAEKNTAEQVNEIGE
jgi:hypothetical protein